VFAGGWSLDDAVSVASGAPLTEEAVVGLHARLVDRSLVVMENAFDASGGCRYRLLETVREFALAQLAEGKETESVRARHLDHFLAVARGYDAERSSVGSDAGLGRLASNRDNYRAALAWASATDCETELELTGLLDDFWRMTSADEGWRQLQHALGASRPESPHRLRGLITAGMLAAYIPAYAAGSALLREASSIARRHGDTSGGRGPIFGSDGLPSSAAMDRAPRRISAARSLPTRRWGTQSGSSAP
jgi:hypothetical protein